MDFHKHKLNLTYPCVWDYRLIGRNEAGVRQAVAQILGHLEHQVSLSSTSRTGKYCSLTVELTVHSEQQRTDLYQAFKGHRDITMVL